jgi:hypothetical protein
MTSGDPVPFEEMHDPSYNRFAATTARVHIVPSERDPEKIHIEGPCARCGHETSFWKSIYASRDLNWAPIRDRFLNRRQRNVAAAETKHLVTVYCMCGTSHPDTPFGRQGCGAYWKVTVEWRADG